MKRWLLLTFIVSPFISLHAVTYYSQGSLDPGVLASWGDLTIGGTSPGSFTMAGDVFIIQAGHTMITTGTWVFGNIGSTLQIQNGGILQGDHVIQFTGIFQIDNGGTYIHNNNNSIASTPGTSIWSGTESFSANSTVEIRNWVNHLATLSSSISWGNLVINLTGSIGGSWNQTGDLTSIQGNLQIISSGTSGQEFRITGATNTVLNIGGNVIVNGGIFNIKSDNTAGTFCIVQVSGNVTVNGGTLSTGVADAVLNSELRFRGNFSAPGGIITSGDNLSYLVANGTSAQTFACAVALGCNFRVAPGAIVNQSGSMANLPLKVIAILGTFNDNGFTNTLSGPLEVAGGTFNSTGSLAMGANRCRSCTGDGTYAGASALWCTGAGARGRINFTSNTVMFSRSSGSRIFIGSGLPGDIYLTNAIINFDAGGSGGSAGSVTLSGGSIFSLDDNSIIIGLATYTGSGGTLRIGSSGGIAASAAIGNIQVSGTRTYNSSGANSFEYFGSAAQFTGDGLPTTIPDTLTINNSAGLGTDGVTLSQATTVNGKLALTNGKLTTTASTRITLGAGALLATAYTDISFVNGPMYWTGNTNFVFPVGKGVAIHPIGLTTVSGGNAGDRTLAEYFNTGPPTCTPATLNAGIHHISGLEYWTLDRAAMSMPASLITLYATTYSQATDRSRLVITRCTGGTGWINLGNANTAVVGSSGPVTSSATVTGSIAIGSVFTLASLDATPINPLPIDLISFDAIKLNSSRSSLVWELAACCSSTAKFDIQRAGKNKNFITIGSAGGSETNKLYNYSDNGLQSGINYYRLKMTDADGTVTFSRTVAVMNGVDGLLLTSLIPTMISHTSMLTVAASAGQKMDIIIVDMQGRIVQQQNYSVVAGNTNIQLSMERLRAGVYQLYGISAEGKTNWIRFIKQ